MTHRAGCRAAAAPGIGDSSWPNLNYGSRRFTLSHGGQDRDYPPATSSERRTVLIGDEANQSITDQALIERVAKQQIRTSPGGKTPQATLYAAMVREIAAKGRSAETCGPRLPIIGCSTRPPPGGDREIARGRGDDEHPPLASGCGPAGGRLRMPEGGFDPKHPGPHCGPSGRTGRHAADGE